MALVRSITSRIWRGLKFRTQSLLGARDEHWARVVMNRATQEYVKGLCVSNLDALELSGNSWQNTGFRSYTSVAFPHYDVCTSPLGKECFDIIIAEQVLEHVLWPCRAVRNVYEMLRADGVFLVTTPFLVRVHPAPVDCTRWTETGLAYLLAECGFGLDDVITGSWGNRACVRANFQSWARWVPSICSLANEPEFPVVVWGFAKKCVTNPIPEFIGAGHEPTTSVP
jgi:hypothetical protein